MDSVVIHEVHSYMSMSGQSKKKEDFEAIRGVNSVKQSFYLGYQNNCQIESVHNVLFHLHTL
jgi:hypothetical protein